MIGDLVVSISQRRQKILRAAETLLARYGYAKTTVADVAREAEIGVGSVYLEFKGKDSIVQALTRKHRDQILDGLAQIASDEARTHAERLAAFLEHRVDAMVDVAERGHHGMDMISCVCPASAQALEEHFTLEADLLAELIRRGVAAAEFAASEPRADAEVILRVAEMYAPGGLRAGEGSEREHAFSMLVRALVTQS